MLISICIPAYKQPNTLDRVLNSIQIQTFRDFEVIISDDSPSDELKEIIFDKNWNFPIRYFKNTPAKGSPENWNAAIENAIGEWIKIIHHDDWLESEQSLEEFAIAINKKPAIDFFYCKSWVYNTQNGNRYLYDPSELRIKNLYKYPSILFEANIIGAPSATIYRSSLKLKYDKNLIWLVDIEFYYRMILNGQIASIEKGLIVTGEEQEFQLTTSLRNNKAIELKEYIYCYCKLKPIMNRANLVLIRRKIIELFGNHNVIGIRDIYETGITKDIPFFIKAYCFLASINKTIAKKIIGKWNYLELKNYDYR